MNAGRSGLQRRRGDGGQLRARGEGREAPTGMIGAGWEEGGGSEGRRGNGRDRNQTSRHRVERADGGVLRARVRVCVCVGSHG